MQRAEGVIFNWHKQKYAEFCAHEVHDNHHGIRRGMELLESILAHAEEELIHYALLTMGGAASPDGKSFSGAFNLVKCATPSPDEFDMGVLLIVEGYAQATPLSGSFRLYVFEYTEISFRK